MKVFSGTITLKTQGFHDSVDITPQVTGRLNESGIVSGLLTVINPGSTGAITTIEYEPGALEDLRRALERIAPVDMPYAHNERWHDGNGFSHVRAALMKPSLSIPVVDGRLCLGTWQQLVFLDFDNRSRNRTLVVQIIGDESP